MAAIKSYTDLEQSKKLTEILPLESADMCWEWNDSHNIWHYVPNIIRPTTFDNIKKCIPCWSLTALLDILPKGTNISTPNPINELSYCCWNHYNEIYADNPVDACYEMILKLNELKML